MGQLLQCFGHVQSKNKDTKSAVNIYIFYLRKYNQFKLRLDVVSMSKRLNEQLKEVSANSILQAMYPSLLKN